MNLERTQEVKAAFLRLVEVDAAERERLLATDYAGDEQLQTAVRRLLASAEAAPDDFLETPPEVVESASRARTASLEGSNGDQGQLINGRPALLDDGYPGKQIGPYRLMRLIGEGGFGVVWEAEQQEPIIRRVALKLIKQGMDSEQVIARFDAERRALALMGHPNISTVLDAGTAENGGPYFAMELVVGQPILAYCAEKKLSLPKALKIFETVCRAIHHAHERGIIHRDIKPSNVLVTECDGDPLPKVIDFGIAKAVSVGAASRLTQHRQLVGTPAYMAPEQRWPGGHDVDSRSDIYSLGVLLYELLTGVLPFGEQESTSAGFDRPARSMDEEPPERPSRRVSGGVALLADLDWITLKCLEQDRSLRYGSALQLADDIRRYLDDEPVHAGPPDLLYRLRKFYLRHRVAVASAAALALTTVVVAVAGLLWTTWKNRQLEASNVQLRAKNEDFLREKALAQRALNDVERLSDAYVLEELMARAERDLWPATPDKIPAMEAWLEEASLVQVRADGHRAELEALRARALPPADVGGHATVALFQQRRQGTVDYPRFRAEESTGDPDGERRVLLERGGSAGESDVQVLYFATTREAWLHGLLSDLVRQLDGFESRDTGPLASVKQRLAFAKELRARSIDAFQAQWQDTVAGVLHGGRYPVLSKEGFAPQIGLVPLGPDPASGLFEFLHLASHEGSIPTRNESGRLQLHDRTGVILVLIPGGAFYMGAQKDDPDQLNYDTLAKTREQPIHEVRVDPFFLGKHELTQAQWMKLDSGTNPSYFYFGLVLKERPVTLRHPVEQVRWIEGKKLLRRAGLVYPTEAQWEYATRAGSSSAWFFGKTVELLPRFANFADSSSIISMVRVTNMDDGYAYTAPVGSFDANPFGLHDVYGNVAEWCDDLFRPNYTNKPLNEPLAASELEAARRRVARGGAFTDLPNITRSASRFAARGDSMTFNLGIRPARVVERS